MSMSFRPQKCQSSLVALTRLLFQHLSLLCCVELSFDLVSLGRVSMNILEWSRGFFSLIRPGAQLSIGQ